MHSASSAVSECDTDGPARLTNGDGGSDRRRERGILVGRESEVTDGCAGALEGVYRVVADMLGILENIVKDVVACYLVCCVVTYAWATGACGQKKGPREKL